jgi:hypothetical protein
MTFNLQNLERWDRYFQGHAELRTFFKNADGFYTFLKTNRDHLVNDGVIVKTTYGIFVDREKLPDALMSTITIAE